MKLLPIPERMQHLKTWRGVAVPFMVVWQDNKPIFSINDDGLQNSARHHQLCTICGTKLFRGRWLVGGPLSAFHPQGAFMDSAMHAECMRYAMQICPYLAAPSYDGSVGPTLIKSTNRIAVPDEILMAETFHLPDRPKVFVAVMTTRPIKININGSSSPQRPYNSVEFWREGQQLTPVDGMRIVLEQYPGIAFGVDA